MYIPFRELIYTHGLTGVILDCISVIQVSTEDSAWEQTDESDDGWTTVVTKTDVERPEDGAVQSSTFAPVAVKYVRVKATRLQEGGDGFVVQLAEIEVYE